MDGRPSDRPSGPVTRGGYFCSPQHEHGQHPFGQADGSSQHGPGQQADGQPSADALVPEVAHTAPAVPMTADTTNPAMSFAIMIQSPLNEVRTVSPRSAHADRYRQPNCRPLAAENVVRVEFCLRRQKW